MAVPLTLADIVSRLGGRLCGDPAVRIVQVGALDSAGPEQITFLSAARHRAKLATTRAGAVILGTDAEALTALPRIVCDNPYAYFARVSQLFNPVVTQAPGVHPSACVSASARLGERVSIGPGCVVGDGVEIGDDTCLYPGVIVYPACFIGARVIVHAGAVIGADGFGIASEHGRWVKIPQIGGVRIGDDVEIGANTTVDRGTLGDTVIEEGVKLDNQIQVGHNVRIGAHTAIAGCTGIAGSANIGRHCVIGGAASILGHLTIVDHVNISAVTVISRSILAPGTYTGIFPFDETKAWARNAALLRHLAELADRVRALERAGEGKDKNA